MIRLLRLCLLVLVTIAVSTAGIGMPSASAGTTAAGKATAVHQHGGESNALSGRHDHKRDALVDHDGTDCLQLGLDCPPVGNHHDEGSGACCGLACHMAMIVESDLLAAPGIGGGAAPSDINAELVSGATRSIERPPRPACA